jgi:hypothetical protein
MSSRSEKVAFRGWVVSGAGVAALALPMALDAIGVVNWPSVSPFDRIDNGLLARICLVSDCMMLACLLVFGAARFRVSADAMFVGEENQGGRIMPAALGVCGVVLFLYQWVYWGPYTGKPFAPLDGWQFVVAWTLLWSCFVFFRGFGQGGASVSHGRMEWEQR